MCINNIWDAVVGESLTCWREPLNPRYRYAVAVVEKFRVYNVIVKKFHEFNFRGLRLWYTILLALLFDSFKSSLLVFCFKCLRHRL